MHPEQRPWHVARHSPLHLWHHLRSQPHPHRRGPADVEAARRNRVLWVVVIAGTFLIALIVLLGLSYGPVNTARQDLTAAKNLIANDVHNKALLTTAAGRQQLAIDIGSVSKYAAEANEVLNGSESLRVLGFLPVLNTQRDGIIQLSDDAEQATEVASAMLDSLNHLVSTSHGTSVSLPALAGLDFYVVEGHKQMAALDRPAGGLIGPIASARTAFDNEDAKIVRLLSLSARTIGFARPFLGSGGPQTYLIAGMNNAEMRDSGAVLSLDLMTADNGTFTIQKDVTYGNYLLSAPANVKLPAGTEKVFGAYQPTEQWPSVDATADFALSGESMQGMWAEATGQHVNGVLGIDVPGVASLLKLTGPVLVPGITGRVTASNVGYLLLDQAYAGESLTDASSARRDKIAAVVKAAVDEMKQQHIDLDAFASTLSKDVAGRHLMVWSDVPSDEAGLRVLDAAGTLTTNQPDRTFHLAVENSTADKLDYFIGVSVGMKVNVDSSGNALVNTTISVANFAQPNQPPSYQYGPDGVNSFTPGQYVARIFFWGPRGAQVPSSTPESGLELTQSHFSLLPLQHNNVSFTTVIHHAVVDGHLQLHLIPQARLIPDLLKVDLRAPGWHVSGKSHLKTKWGSTLNLSWGLSR
jgi:uncharacterized protein DUF4012